MKQLFKYLALSAAAIFAFAACETYKPDPIEYTNVSWLDGRYICFATNAEDKTVFEVEITNTTDNAADAAWMNIIDYSFEHGWNAIYDACLIAGLSEAAADYYADYYLPRLALMQNYAFKMSCDAASKSFSCTNAAGFEREMCWNEYLSQAYYTAAGYFEGYKDYVITVANGKITPGVATASGKTTDGISFDITIVDKYNNTTTNYAVSGIRKTGWAEDAAEYAEWIDNQ